MITSEINFLPMCLPFVGGKKEIFHRFEAQFVFADRIEARLITAQKTIECFIPATQAKAFRGKLLLQDTNDESARMMLKRLNTLTPTTPVKSRRAGNVEAHNFES